MRGNGFTEAEVARHEIGIVRELRFVHLPEALVNRRCGFQLSADICAGRMRDRDQNQSRYSKKNEPKESTIGKRQLCLQMTEHQIIYL